MSLHLRQNLKKSRNWYVKGTVTIWKDGRSDRISVDKSTFTTDEEEAQGILQQIQTDVIARNISNKDPVPTFGEVADDYMVAGGTVAILGCCWLRWSGLFFPDLCRSLNGHFGF